jgi:hypothetical protein
VFAFESVEHQMEETGLTEPFYVKHAKLLQRQSGLTRPILVAEASHHAEALIKVTPPVTVAGKCVVASVAHYSA